MSVSFGPIDSRADFFAALDASLRYAQSDDFWIPSFARHMLRELSAIRAWTEDGRTPLIGERDAITLPHVLYRMREELRDPEPAEWLERSTQASNVAWYFQCWPEDEEASRTRTYYGASLVSRVPDVSELQTAALAIADALDGCGVREPRPADEAFESTKPVMSDTMTPTAWIRWVLIPSLDDIVQGRRAIPKTSQVCLLVMDIATNQTLWPVLRALGYLDSLFRTPIANADDDSFDDDD